jgi:hypothetical protein
MQSKTKSLPTQDQESGIIREVVLQMIFWMLYVGLFFEIWEVYRAHRFSFGIWMLPILYPLPYATRARFKRWVRSAVTENLLTEKAASYCSDRMTEVVIGAYFLVFAFGSMGFWGPAILP